MIKGLSIGRVVHYVDADGETHWAAIISNVKDKESGIVDLHIMVPRIKDPVHVEFDCYYDSEGKKPFSWHSPEYVE